MPIKPVLALALAGLLVAGQAAAQLTAAAPVCLVPHADVDPRRSLFVTELEVLEQAVSLEDVLGALADDVGNPAFGPLTLWQQLWDTQNTGPGLGLGFNCDDQLDANGNPVLNGFPIQCPRNEGAEVNVDPFDPNLPSFYELIALVNRMDLAPTDGANCGEFRAIFARSAGSRNLLIFEAVLPNPNPGCGLEGCRAVARFWEKLSEVDDPARRAAALRKFYLRGFPSRGIEPVIRAAHFNVGTGQIRTNQFMSGPNPQRWQLREFKLVQLCPTGGNCMPLFAPVTTKQNPFGELFDETSGLPRTFPFQRQYLTQIKNLAVNDIHGFFAEAPDRFNAGQSTSQTSENNYPSHFAGSPHFRAAIDFRLNRIGSRLTADHLVRRSMAMSCAGCHQLSNNAPANDLGGGITWPPSLSFVHVDETLTEFIDGQEHFLISPALEDVFIPKREQVFERYLDGVACRDCPDALLADGPPPPHQIDIDPSGELTIVISPDSLRALDNELKAGTAADNIGGTRAVHCPAPRAARTPSGGFLAARKAPDSSPPFSAVRG